jgi:hypothetical protein
MDLRFSTVPGSSSSYEYVCVNVSPKYLQSVVLKIHNRTLGRVVRRQHSYVAHNDNGGMAQQQQQ